MLRFLTVAVAALSMLAFAVSQATAANVTIVSMHYSAERPVPHIRYEGDTLPGDVEALQAILDEFIHCDITCIGEEGGNVAVLSMAGPGGSYGVGLALADLIRANHIATVVERDDGCFSACAFAFLGGSGYSASDRIGTYVDRWVEPGSKLGFHAPYMDEETLRAALEERAPTEVMGVNRNLISIMVKELVRWNVDPEIIFWMVDMGPQQTYDVVNADDLYLTRTALPPTPTSSWITDIPTAVRNACLRLLALYERTDPILLQDAITSEWEPGIGHTQFGTLSGYRLGHDLLALGHCSVTDESVANGHDLEIALYMNPGLDGTSSPILSMFNREDWFSTAGIGGDPLKRVFQRGGLNHWFLPVGVNIDTFDLPGEFEMRNAKFFTVDTLAFPLATAEITVEGTAPGARISRSGNVWVFEQVGSDLLYDAARWVPETGMTVSYNDGNDTGFVMEGVYPNGTEFTRFGLRSGQGVAVVTAFIVPLDGAEPTADERALLRRLQCAASFGGVNLAC